MSNSVARASRGTRVVLIASQFHPAIADALVRGAIATLSRAGVPRSRIRLVRAPGAFELPVIAARMARGRFRPHAIIALGALIRGDTPQYKILAHAVASGLTQVAVETGVPVTFGVIVATTLAQARARAGLPAPRSAYHQKARQAGGDVGNRGAEAASAALEIMRLFNSP